MNQEIQIKEDFTGVVENPTRLINNANKVADAFKVIVDTQQMYTEIQKSKHIHANGWSMLGVLLGVFPETIKTERVAGRGTFPVTYVKRKFENYNKTKSWTKNVWVHSADVLPDDEVITESEREEITYKAVVALHTASGRKVGQVTATCSNREGGKLDNEEYAIESMAQTRGTGKVYRMAFGWIAKMAGYAETPFEEMSGVLRPEKQEPARPPMSQDKMDDILQRIDSANTLVDLKPVVDSIKEYSKEMNTTDSDIVKDAIIAKRDQIKAENAKNLQKDDEKEENDKEEVEIVAEKDNNIKE